MKIVITGGKGMLGRTLQQELREHDLVIADLPDAAGFDGTLQNRKYNLRTKAYKK